MNGTQLMNLVIIMLIVQGFFSMGITLISYGLPEDARNKIGMFTENQNDILETEEKIESSLTKQTNIPIIDMGALVFYSGNLVIDLLLNFIFAIPEMITLLMNCVLIIFSIDPFIIQQLQIFTSVLFSMIYFIGIIQLILGMRSGSASFL